VCAGVRRRPVLGRIVAVLALLIAVVDRKNVNRRTTLFDAAKHGHVATVQVLVQANADVNFSGKGRLTSLQVPCPLGSNGRCDGTAAHEGRRR
jgi:hypothetical protein